VAVRRAALSLHIVELRALMVELLHRRAALGANLRQTRRDGKALGTCRLCRTCSGVNRAALALDALALRSVVVGSRHCKAGRQQNAHQKSR
jgi:hypothetical protein